MVAVGRLFLGIDLPLDDRLALATMLEPLTPFPGRTVPPENWHITVRFLGRTEDVALDRMLHALDEATLGSPFHIRLAGLGAFPRPRRASVLWMGVDDEAGGLIRLNQVAEDAAQAAGFAAEERPFHAHLTLSRIRPPQDVWAWLEQEPELPRPVRVDALSVFETRSGSGASRYEVRERLEL